MRENTIDPVGSILFFVGILAILFWILVTPGERDEMDL